MSMESAEAAFTTSQATVEESDNDEDTLAGRFLTFALGDEDYGIGISYVREIVGVQKISAIPDMPKFVRGVINLRGLVIPIMDVRMRFHMNFTEYDERTCIVVVDLSGSPVGLVVDRVKEVTKVHEKDISKPPQVAQSEAAKYILGIARVGETVKILLDVGKLLEEEDLDLISKNRMSEL